MKRPETTRNPPGTNQESTRITHPGFLVASWWWVLIGSWSVLIIQVLKNANPQHNKYAFTNVKDIFVCQFSNSLRQKKTLRTFLYNSNSISNFDCDSFLICG